MNCTTTEKFIAWNTLTSKSGGKKKKNVQGRNSNPKKAIRRTKGIRKKKIKIKVESSEVGRRKTDELQQSSISADSAFADSTNHGLKIES